jgi:hypothetical protein
MGNFSSYLSSYLYPNAFSFVKALCVEPKPHLESELIMLLKSIIQLNPTVMHERDDYGYTLLYYAVESRSVQQLSSSKYSSKRMEVLSA